MGKRYLSNNERERVMKILFLKEELGDFTTKWKSKGHLTTEQSRNLSSAVTFLDKGLGALITNLKEKSVKKIQKDARNLTIEFRTKYDIGGIKDRLREKIVKREKAKTVETPIWLLEDFMDFSLNTCSVSCKFKGNASECPIRHIYTELNFEPFTAVPEGDNCEYYLPGKLQRDTLVDTLVNDVDNMQILVDKMSPQDKEELIERIK